jgi:hypothetical protein
MSPVIARENVVSASRIIGRTNSFRVVSFHPRWSGPTTGRSVASSLKINESLDDGTLEEWTNEFLKENPLNFHHHCNIPCLLAGRHYSIIPVCCVNYGSQI